VASSAFVLDPSVARAEWSRISTQLRLDAQTSLKDRNVHGQFATPPSLADDIAAYALTLHDTPTVRFLEPACGTGAFYSALLRQCDPSRIDSAIGVESDPRFADASRNLWGPLGLQVQEADFTRWISQNRSQASLVLANPPYARHHHIPPTRKRELCSRATAHLGLHVSGLSGLYVHFLLLTHQALAPGAISAWLVPSEFMDVNYGRAIREYLTRHVLLHRIHMFDPADVQFADALVSSAVVFFANRSPSPHRVVEFTYGGSISCPRDRRALLARELHPEGKWIDHFREPKTRPLRSTAVLGDYFRVQRGIATGANKFFILPRPEAETRGFRRDHLTPILPSPRYVDSVTIESDAEGWPSVPRQLALLDASVPLSVLRTIDPQLATYFDTAEPALRAGYLVRQRSPWYRQEQRKPSPFMCTYMGRGNAESHPFRFILNRSRAVGTNVYLMLYPTPLLQAYIDSSPKAYQRIHEALVSLTPDDLRSGGRVYGGGLHKIEPKELMRLGAEAISALDPATLAPRRSKQMDLLP